MSNILSMNIASSSSLLLPSKRLALDSTVLPQLFLKNCIRSFLSRRSELQLGDEVLFEERR